jgi:hypothetical protein
MLGATIPRSGAAPGALPAAREIMTLPSSRGWRSASSTRWENSGSSSREACEATVHRLAAVRLEFADA